MLSSALVVEAMERLRSRYKGILAAVVTVYSRIEEDLQSIPYEGT